METPPIVLLVNPPDRQAPGYNLTDRVPGYQFRVDFEDDPDAILVQQVVGSLTIYREDRAVVEGTWKFFEWFRLNGAGHLSGPEVDVHKLYSTDPKMQAACTLLIERVSMLVGKATLDPIPAIGETYGVIGQGIEHSGLPGFRHPALVHDIPRIASFQWRGDKQGWTHTYRFEGATGKESMVIAGIAGGMYVFPR